MNQLTTPRKATITDYNGRYAVRIMRGDKFNGAYVYMTKTEAIAYCEKQRIAYTDSTVRP